MNAENFLIETHPARMAIDFIEDQLDAYNIAQTGIDFGGLLACFVRAPDGGILAGISGWTWGNCCEIRTLWVHASLRGRGYGRRLLQAAEQEALRRGCTQVVLDTHSFQAPTFYLKMGYEVVGIVEGYPNQHQQIYLKKHLNG